MEKFNESEMRSWIDLVDFDHSLEDGLSDVYDKESPEALQEAPQAFDAFRDSGATPEEVVRNMSTEKRGMQLISDEDGIQVYRNKLGTSYVAFGGENKELAAVKGLESDGIFKVEVSAGLQKGVVYRIYMDILNQGLSILSDKYQSESAINFWKKLIMQHTVYVVGGGEVLGLASPQKFHKYWSDDPNSPSAELQFLMVE